MIISDFDKLEFTRIIYFNGVPTPIQGRRKTEKYGCYPHLEISLLIGSSIFTYDFEKVMSSLSFEKPDKLPETVQVWNHNTKEFIDTPYGKKI